MSKSVSSRFKTGQEVMDELKYTRAFFSDQERRLLIKVIDDELTRMGTPEHGGIEMIDRLTLFNNSIAMLIDLIKIKTFEPENWTFDILKDGWYSVTYNELQGGAGIVAVRSRIFGLAKRRLEAIDQPFYVTGHEVEYLSNSIACNSLICKEKISLINQLVTQGIDYLGAVSA